jgi:hypothetical protein
MGSSVVQHLKHLAIIAMLLCSSQALGATVGLLVEDNNQQVRQFKSTLNKGQPSVNFQLYTLQNLPEDLSLNTVDTWLAMGAKPLAVLLGRLKTTSASNKKRILGLFVRIEAKRKLENLYPNKHFSLLDNTPQIDRQLALIKILSPQIKSIALLHSEVKHNNLDKIKQTAEKFGLNIKSAVINDPLNWNRASLKALKESDAVLGLTDTAIYNATTIRSILMRLYRASRPLIGPDKGYVKAGAVASSYSGVKETIKAVSELLSSKQPWPAIIPNPYFNIVINTQVARSLNINVADQTLLAQQVRELLK